MAKGPKPRKSTVQQFEIVRMARSEIKAAEYNPRDPLDDRTRKKLLEMLKRNGLVEPIVVNRRTNRVVSGHQRLDAIDSIEKTTDYFLDVALVDLDETAEKEQVVAFNNPLMQGAFDVPKLMGVLKESDFELCGFEPFEIKALVPAWEAPPEEKDDLTEQDVGLDVVLVFPDRAQTDAFMELIGMTAADKYVAGELIAGLVENGLAK